MSVCSVAFVYVFCIFMNYSVVILTNLWMHGILCVCVHARAHACMHVHTCVYVLWLPTLQTFSRLSLFYLSCTE
jgi:hypothetical protein